MAPGLSPAHQHVRAGVCTPAPPAQSLPANVSSEYLSIPHAPTEHPGPAPELPLAGPLLELPSPVHALCTPGVDGPLGPLWPHTCHPYTCHPDPLSLPALGMSLWPCHHLQTSLHLVPSENAETRGHWVQYPGVGGTCPGRFPPPHRASWAPSSAPRRRRCCSSRTCGEPPVLWRISARPPALACATPSGSDPWQAFTVPDIPSAGAGAGAGGGRCTCCAPRRAQPRPAGSAAVGSPFCSGHE